MNQQPDLSKPEHLGHTAPTPTLITIDQFINLVKLQTAKIVHVEHIPNKDKLYKIQLEVGNTTRTIVSGIRGWYPQPEELVGKTIAIVSNLEPKKVGGVESHGMLLAALDDEGNFSLLVTEKPVKSGAEIR